MRADCTLKAPQGRPVGLFTMGYSMGMLKSWRVSTALLLLAGCSGNSQSPPAAAPPASPPSATAPPPPADAPRDRTVFDPLTQQLARAKGVQGTVDEAASRQREAVDAQERGNAPP